MKISESGLKRESIFGIDTILDPVDVRKSIYQGKVDWKGRQFDQDFRVGCLQGWFFRSSWSEKFRFVKEICDLTIGVHVLERVLKCVDAIHSKDVIDSFGRDRIHYPFDTIPFDDNRAMTADELFEVKQEGVLWFVNLDSAKQVDVIVNLLKLGGGGLIFSAYKEIDRLYRERREMNMVLTAVTASLREFAEKEEVENVRNSRVEESLETKNKYTIQKEEQMLLRNAELNEFRRKNGLATGNGKKREPTEIVDRIQLLPIWLNRKIVLQLDEKELGQLKRTGKYWSGMIEEALREKAARAAIDERIARIDACGASRREETPEESEDVPEVPVLGEEALLAQLRLRHSDLVRILKESKHGEMKVTVWEETCFNRIVCCSNEACRLFAATISTGIITFYSLRTGVRTRNVVTGLTSVVTGMALHDEGFEIVVGFENGSLHRMNIRKNERTMTYNGHSGPILWIHVTDDKLLSAAADRSVKHFDLWSGLCLSRFNLDDSITSMIALKWDSAIAGTAEGKLVFIDLGKKKIYREVVVHGREVKGIAQVDGLLVTHSGDRTIRLWSLNHLENCGEKIRPFWSLRLKSVANAVVCFGNEIFAACADGKVRLICKLTGAATRVVEVTQKKPIAGIYVMQEKDTTKMIMWHEGGIEMRSFSTGKVPRKKQMKKKKKTTEDGASPLWRNAEGQLTRRRLFSILPQETVRPPLPQTYKVKRWKSTDPEDRKMIQADRSCTSRKLREELSDEMESTTRDVFTEMMKKFDNFKYGELKTFSRLRYKGVESTSDLSSDEIYN